MEKRFEENQATVENDRSFSQKNVIVHTSASQTVMKVDC